MRVRYKEDGDWHAYTRGFLGYLATQKAAIVDLSRTALAQRACLVCFEADFGFCHRTYVARAAHRAGAPAVQHLTARTVVADAPVRLAASAVGTLTISHCFGKRWIVPIRNGTSRALDSVTNF